MCNKFAFLFLLVIAIIPTQGFAQSNQPWQVSALGGVFSPADDELQNVYGDAAVAKLAVGTPIGQWGRLRFATDYFNRDGDPFYQSKDFDAGDAGELTLTGISLSLQTNPLTTGYPRLYFGAGVDYVFAKEEIIGQDTGDGSAIGAHVSFTPEFRISQRLIFVTEASYRFLEITFKSGRERYQFNLSGARLLIGLGLNLGT
ncbi:hypothetical protein GWO43_02405 [candidate division KSB1 bacterium]|nr:hypothetical protein [candidate division KSB1 bacterium]NIR69717.1 hypothetical protein [candidate division KSB1 bacterium]NIS22905.1 hypothetical protein [candidate division KSB1 bacterium]NIT69762.1 hypothetical protein [candidate division KSB1 bacterium]NIU23436.1 hypothetical protein [candidate division KSB1 bacterium]